MSSTLCRLFVCTVVGSFVLAAPARAGTTVKVEAEHATGTRGTSDTVSVGVERKGEKSSVEVKGSATRETDPSGRPSNEAKVGARVEIKW